MDAARGRRELVRGLQLAYSGEWGAIHAYLGHRASLPHGPDRALIRRILIDEIRHRRVVLRMLTALGSRPDPHAERKLWLIGKSIAAFCLVGGWFFPMYGAARLEAQNVEEYEVLARLALLAGEERLVDELLHLAEVEWDHERWLRERAETHELWRLVPRWKVPPPRERIRTSFAEFRSRPGPTARQHRPVVR